MRRLANGLEKVSRRMILGITDNRDANAETRVHSALGNGIGRVVGAFSVNVRPKFFEERFHTGLGEEHDVVDTTQRGNELRAGGFAENGTARTLQTADTGIVV